MKKIKSLNLFFKLSNNLVFFGILFWAYNGILPKSYKNCNSSHLRSGKIFILVEKNFNKKIKLTESLKKEIFIKLTES